ncbi:MAG: dTDP-4-dehydrorhamnose reductase [Bacteroidetes bacterium]|nr:MAG: dTDP-4-dehydrorhamnose reductase [Bacteroidota bacterium]
MNILVTGSYGQLGSEIRDLADKFIEHQFVFVDSKECDITNKELIKEWVSTNEIDAIINCAAYTAVDLAEDEPKKARLVNVDGVRNLVEVSEEFDLKLIHISTDYVFDGSARIPISEEAMVNPIGVYGKTKAEGEKFVIMTPADAIVIRTSWVYSSYGKNFVKTILRLMEEKPELNIVSDQFGSPTYARDLAHACVKIILKGSRISEKGRVYHYCNEGVINWYQFAKAIAELSGNVDFPIHAITTDQFPTKAKRPVYSALSNEKIRTDFDISIRDWKEALTECLKRIREGNLN